jgi:tetratricopeptide (TPR) repeat protein
LGRRDWHASAHNQLGNLLMAQGFFERALGEYALALELHPGEAEERRLQIEINLGYAHVVLGQPRRGVALLYRCLRGLRALGARRGQMFAHIDLCFALLEAGRLPHAIRHGLKGLRLAETLGEADAVKNALYLLGEARNLAGEEEAAYRLFSRLQEEFYPGSSGIAAFLMAIDVRKMINLRA